VGWSEKTQKQGWQHFKCVSPREKLLSPIVARHKSSWKKDCGRVIVRLQFILCAALVFPLASLSFSKVVKLKST